MKIAIFARRTGSLTRSPEPQCDRFRTAALDRGHEVRDADVGAFIRGDVDVVVGGAILIGGVRVDDVDAVILGPLPGPAARTTPPGLEVSAEAHALLTTQQYERHVLAWAIVGELEARGIPVLSSPSKARPLDFKPAQLLALARAGLPVPRTRITRGLGVSDDVDWLQKPIAGGPVVTLGTTAMPAIQQPRMRGCDLRAVVVGDEVVAVARFPGDDDVVDLRQRPAFVDGSACWEREDNERVAVLARAAAQVCCCDFAAVDLKMGRRQSDHLTILEVNRTPVVIDIEDDLGAPITQRFLDLVEERAR